MFAMSESPKFRQIQKKYKSRIEKRKERLALRSTASCLFCGNTEKRYPYVTKAAAAEQQHSSSSAEAQQKQLRRRWWRWRRRRRRRRRQHGKPFFAQLSQQHRSPQSILISTTSGETFNTIYNTNQKKKGGGQNKVYLVAIWPKQGAG